MLNGNVGIGTSNPQARLALEGNILAKQIQVTTDISAPDYVFEPDYELKSLGEISDYVKVHKHNRKQQDFIETLQKKIK